MVVFIPGLWDASYSRSKPSLARCSSVPQLPPLIFWNIQDVTAEGKSYATLLSYIWSNKRKNALQRDTTHRLFMNFNSDQRPCITLANAYFQNVFQLFLTILNLAGSIGTSSMHTMTNISFYFFTKVFIYSSSKRQRIKLILKILNML